VVASAVNYNRRKIYKAKAEEINFIFNSIPIGICRTDLHGNILTQNKFLSSLLRREHNKKQTNLAEFINDSSFTELFSNIDNTNEDAHEVSVNYKNEDGQMIYLSRTKMKLRILTL
jgi:PAS domain-containing protein